MVNSALCMKIAGDNVEKKKAAALAYALGCARSLLSDVLEGDFSREQARRIYEASATRNIAESIGMTEADFDFNLDLLTEAEKHNLQGYETE